MRNKHGYTHIGGQLPRKLSASEALGAAYGAPRIPGTLSYQSSVTTTHKFSRYPYELENLPRKGPTLANFIAQNRHAEAEMHRVHQAALDAGFTQGVQDEMIAPSSWSDTQLAALVADMRKHEEVKVSQFAQLDFEALERRCVMDEVQQVLPRYVPLWARPVPVNNGRKIVPVESIVQGDKVFMTGGTTPRTVLYVHVSDLFVSLVIISHQDAMPFMVHRHRGGLINKEA